MSKRFQQDPKKPKVPIQSNQTKPKSSNKQQHSSKQSKKVQDKSKK
jgi:hypothetical protein